MQSPINAHAPHILRAIRGQMFMAAFEIALEKSVELGLLRQHESGRPALDSHFSLTPLGMQEVLAQHRGEHLDELLKAACALFESLTPDEQAHHRHAQRISFATGNVALGHPTEMRSSIEAAARRAAGPCPCMKCGGG